MNFGFVVHPLSRTQKNIAAVRTLSPRALVGDSARAGRVARYPEIVSITGARASGEVRAISMMPGAMLVDQARAVDRIAKAANALVENGAGIIGLGSLCAVVGLRGEEVARRVSVPVTTGVSFTAFAATRTLDRVASALGETVAGSTVAIAGFPGALAEGLAELLAARHARVVLLAPSGKAVDRAALRLSAEVASDPVTAIAAADFVLGASSTGGALDPAWLASGSVVIDVAEPRDLPRRIGRPDVLVVDGENVSLPPGAGNSLGLLTRVYNWVVGQRDGTVYACFAEPIVLALEGRAEAFSLGKAVLADHAEEIGRLGEKHGFVVDKILHRGVKIPAADIDRIRAIRSGRTRILPRAATSA